MPVCVSCGAREGFLLDRISIVRDHQSKQFLGAGYVCSFECIERLNEMVDPTPEEKGALIFARNNAAQYLMSENLMDKPLNSFTPEQVMTFLSVVVSNYNDSLNASMEIPF